MTNIRPVPDDNDEPIDPFSLENVRYDEAEFTHGDIDAKKQLTAIKVRKPVNDKEWFRLHPGRDYQWPVALYLRVSDESIAPETYLVPSVYHHLFKPKALTPVRLRLVVSSVETVFLWDMKVSRNGLQEDYHRSLQQAAEAAERTWVKLEWDNATRVYHFWPAPDDLGDPQFPEGKTMQDLVKLGFNGRVIDRAEHPVVLEYQGRKA